MAVVVGTGGIFVVAVVVAKIMYGKVQNMKEIANLILKVHARKHAVIGQYLIICKDSVRMLK